MVLRVVNLLKVGKPLFDGDRFFVESDAINVSSGGSINTFTSGILPHSAGVHVAVVNVIRLVQTVDSSLIEGKFVGH